MPRKSSLTLSQIYAFIEQRRTDLSQIPARVQRLGEEIDALEKELASLGEGVGKAVRAGRPGPGKKAAGMKAAKRTGGKRVRPPAGSDLASMLTKVLEGAKGPMGIAELAAAVKDAGYKSTSPDFVKIVGMRLSTDKKRFKRAAPGKYTAA